MVKRTGPTNPVLKELVHELKKVSSTEKSKIWKRIATDLEKSTRNRRAVNISRINRFTQANEVIIVPGKVLGSGTLNHGLTVAAFSFSEGAKKIITEAKGKAITISELLKQKPKTKDIKIIG